jgi:hypothetical protein
MSRVDLAVAYDEFSSDTGIELSQFAAYFSRL